jgi:XRE family transcriptional regulator, master regulator for biofilm formation
MIGKNIADIRKKRGYTLTELADLANISKSYLSNIERSINRNPSVEVMQKIATVLNVDLLTLLKPNLDLNIHLDIEKEWIDFLIELKELGIKKDQIHQYKTVIEFIKWQKGNGKPE